MEKIGKVNGVFNKFLVSYIMTSRIIGTLMKESRKIKSSDIQ